jgi:hypothetical protein
MWEKLFGQPEQWLRGQVGRLVAKEMGQLPEPAKAAMERTRVNVIRRPDRIEVAIEADGDPDVEKVRDVFLGSLHEWLPPMIGLLGFRVNANEK